MGAKVLAYSSCTEFEVPNEVELDLGKRGDILRHKQRGYEDLDGTNSIRSILIALLNLALFHPRFNCRADRISHVSEF